MALYLAGEHHPHEALMPRVIYVALAGDSLVGYIVPCFLQGFRWAI